MVQEYAAPIREYEYPFEYVMEAYQRRFGPDGCPDIPVIKKLDIVEENHTENGHHILRRCMMQPEIPGMLRRMMGIDQIFFCQRNVLDIKERRLEITAWNESFDNRVTVKEKCVYWAEGNITKFSQEATLTISNFWGFESTVERLMIRQYQASMKQGKEILTKHLKQMEEEKSPVERLRNMIDPELGQLDPIYLQRFINSRDGSLERAVSAAKKYHEARQTWNVKDLAGVRVKQPQEWGENFHGKWLGNDLEGGPVLVIPWGKIAARAVFKSLGEDEIIKSAIRLIENRPEPSQQFSALIDCDDVCLRQGWASKDVMNTMLKMSDVLSHLYPDSLRRVLLVRAPAPFPAIWTVISPLLDEKTRAKVWLYSGSETAKNLQNYLKINAIPTWLGGDAEFETSGRDESDTGYRSVNLPHVEEISGNKGTIIHWDIQKNETTNLENFEIEGEGKTADLDVLSLTGKSNRNGGSCIIESSPVRMVWHGTGAMGLFIAALPSDDIRASVSSLDSFQSGFSQLSC